jgi:hypothetical protein
MNREEGAKSTHSQGERGDPRKKGQVEHDQSAHKQDFEQRDKPVDVIKESVQLDDIKERKRNQGGIYGDGCCLM